MQPSGLGQGLLGQAPGFADFSQPVWAIESRSWNNTRTGLIIKPQKGTRAETVAYWVADDVRYYLAGDAPVDQHLADQLLLPMALAGGGEFVTTAPTPHTLTNIAVIEKNNY